MPGIGPSSHHAFPYLVIIGPRGGNLTRRERPAISGNADVGGIAWINQAMTRSNRLGQFEGYAVAGVADQEVWSRIKALRVTSSLRMRATRTTFGGLFRASRRRRMS